jgi:hypothetical protein
MWLADHGTIRLNGTVADEDTGEPVPVVELAMPRWRAHSLAVALDKWSQVAALLGDGEGLDESELARMLRAAVDAADG